MHITIPHTAKLGMVALAILALPTTAAPKKLYELTLEEIKVEGNPLNLSLVFPKKLPPADVVDALLRESLESAVRFNGGKDILAMAWLGDAPATATQNSNSWIYVAAKRKVMTMDDYRGVKKSSISRKSYHISIEQRKTIEGIKPERRWLDISLVYPTKPIQENAYKDMIAEIRNLASGEMDFNAYIFVGSKTSEGSWKQVRDKRGGYVFCKYEKASGRIIRKDEVIGVVSKQ